MKKYLVGFGLVMIFFAGFSSVQAEDPESWEPVYITENVNNYTTCKNAGGTWITVPLTDHPKGKACLKTKDKGAACDGLDFDITKPGEKKEDKEVDVAYDENYGKYVIKNDEIEYKNSKYVLKKGDYDVEIKCYKDGSSFESKNLLKNKKNPSDQETYTNEANENKTRKNVCIVDESDLRIKAIDFSRDSDPEWYCPYNWSNQYPEGANPYNPEDDYFKNKLKDSVYKFEVEDSSELTHDCARRMFALGKACADRVERTTDVVDKIKQLRRDFYRKMSIKFWRGIFIKADGIDAYHQWLEIKDMTFKKICGAKNGECSESVYFDSQKEKEKDKYKFGKDSDKTKAIKTVQDWLAKEENKKLINSSKTPAKYFEDKASDLWKIIDVGAVQNVLKEDITSIWGGGTIDKDDKKKLKDYMGGKYKEKDLNNLGWSEGNSATKKYSALLSKANAKNHSATLVSKYISRRSNDLNVAVSANQTSHIEVTKLLRAYGNGEEKSSSKEADLMIFNDKKKGKRMINVFDKIINLAVQTMGTLAILLLIISGVIMVVSSGEEDRLSQAKSVFIYTLVGLIVGFLSYTIVRFVIDTLLS